ncbi:hypothetical protein [Pantoea sp. USHLN256]|uniref:hypothetical protein n=1 Tax=Pantoea sp. USHLN256 TaxID=3081293 RepID=UPI00301A8772
MQRARKYSNFSKDANTTSSATAIMVAIFAMTKNGAAMTLRSFTLRPAAFTSHCKKQAHEF